MSKRFFYTILLGLLLTTVVSCKYLSFYRSIKGQKIQFGSGGGFTGLFTEYTLNDKGELFMASGLNAEPKLLKTLSKTELKDVFKKISSLGKDSKEMNNPGNITHFIRLSGGNSPFEIKWSDLNSAPAELKTLYELLTRLTVTK